MRCKRQNLCRRGSVKTFVEKDPKPPTPGPGGENWRRPVRNTRSGPGIAGQVLRHPTGREPAGSSQPLRASARGPARANHVPRAVRQGHRLRVTRRTRVLRLSCAKVDPRRGASPSQFFHSQTRSAFSSPRPHASLGRDHLRRAVLLSHRIYSLMHFRKSTPPQNWQLIVYYYSLKY